MTGAESLAATAATAVTPATTLVLAQAPAPGAGLGQLVPIFLVFAVFYFLLIRPQQKKQKEHQALVDALKKNDRVVTAGGLHGRVLEVTETVVTLEIAKGVSVRHERAQIGSIVSDRKKEE